MSLLLLMAGVPAPANTVAPVVSGDATVGETLTCTTGTWTGAGIIYTYQWRLGDGEPIVGATNSTYVLTEGEEGVNVYCTVTATNAGGSASANSNEVGPVAAAGVVASLEFSGTNQWLSKTDADFGTINYAKYAIALSFRADAVTDRRGLYIKAEYDASNSQQDAFFLMLDDGSIRFVSRDASDNESQLRTTYFYTSTATWYAVLIHFDSANATSGDRIKMWVNGSAITPDAYTAPTAQTKDSDTQFFVVGAGGANSSAGANEFDGLIYSAAFFSGTLPAAGDVFDGTAGKLKDLTGLTGLHSLLTGQTATDDYLLTDWTNNGTVTTNASVP